MSEAKVKTKARKGKKTPGCDCLVLVQESLAKENLRLTCVQLCMDFNARTASQQLYLPTERIDKKLKKGTGKLCPTFCPFCGERAIQ